MTVLTSLLALTNYRNPFLRTLIPSLGLAYGIQAAVAIPSIYAQNERFYDLSGSFTYLSCTALSLFLPAIRARSAAHLAGVAQPVWPSLISAFTRQAGPLAGPLALNWRQVALSAAVSIWATRLGTYLFARISADKGDSRFEQIRQKPLSFFGAFMIQATWVSLCLMPIVATNSLPASTFAALGAAVTVTDVIGLLLYVGGLGFEVAADRQKSAWVEEKKQKKHDEDFLTRGLWSKSRHPNYFGESTLWTGIATVSAGVLMSNPGVAAMGLSAGLAGKAVALLTAGISPAFVSFLLLKVSGVPLSENKYDKRYGDREDYQKWKRETPVFFPKL
jgi:steroid 5-alpha reductase family enzyme